MSDPHRAAKRANPAAELLANRPADTLQPGPLSPNRLRKPLRLQPLRYALLATAMLLATAVPTGLPSARAAPMPAELPPNLARPFSADLPADAHWPQWRGPTGQGTSSQLEAIPRHWNRETHVRWFHKFASAGNSTPVIWGDRLFVTSASQDGRTRWLICLERRTGELQWQHAIEAAAEPTHPSNPHASSSPVTDGQHVVAWLGSAGVHCFRMDGERLWSTNLGHFEHVWGTASSPVIADNLVILNAGPGLRSFVVALDLATGQEKWRFIAPEATSAQADEFRGSWSSPVLIPRQDRGFVWLALPEKLHVLDARTGEPQWAFRGLGKLVVPTPVWNERYVFAMSSYGGPALAVEHNPSATLLDRRPSVGDSTAEGPSSSDTVRTPRVAWRHESPNQNLERVGSAVIVDGYCYLVNEPGIAWCLAIETGEVLWKHRLGDSAVYGSLCHVDGHLYVTNNAGTTFVLEPSPRECRVIAENPLGEPTRASLAFAPGQVFIRTLGGLYCIETPAEKGGCR